MIELLWLVYLIGGIAILGLSTYLSIYYWANSRKMKKPKYFKSLSLVFVPYTIFGVIWIFAGLMSIFGIRETYLSLQPFLGVWAVIASLMSLSYFIGLTNTST